MLFTAGMGIGLVYFGVAEPVAHFTTPPIGEAGTNEAARQAMNLTYFHWLLHPWAIYIVLGLSMAYASFRKNLPFRPAAIFYPLIGDRINGPIGHTVDVLAVFGTIFGLATSLGLGARQIGAGLQTLFGVQNSVGLQLLLIAGITAVAVASLMLGIDRGIRRLSEINLWLAVSLTVFVFLVGPTVFILTSLADNVGYYLQNIIGTSMNMFAFSDSGQEWQSGWTLFYWAWWISWSPFVGMFIARISKGRTIRQFVGGVLLAPVGASAVWFSVFGGTALRTLLEGSGDALAEAGSESALFVLLDGLPIPGGLVTLSSVLAIIVVVLFFATSSDSGSLVVDILTNGGDPEPVWQQRLFWAVTEGAVAMVLLSAGAATGEDPLAALQTASVTAGLPFCVVLLGMCYALVVALREERVPPRVLVLDEHGAVVRSEASAPAAESAGAT
jgi:choline/glycine/proline betaine transport protein